MTDPESQHSESRHSESVHRGYDLETGVLARVRDWVDIFPWIRLGRVLRVAGAPSLLCVTAVAMAIDALGAWFLFGSEPRHLGSLSSISGYLFAPVVLVAQHLWTISPSALLMRPSYTSTWVAVLRLAWSLLVWIPVALVLVRQGALLAADRPMMGLSVVVRHAISRTPSAWIVAIVPGICVLMIGAIVWGIGLVARFFAGVSVAELGMGGLAAIIAIPAGILALGAFPAIPMAWAAVSNEPQPDPLDSLSRGYEYFYRRPLRWLMYVAVSIVLLVVGALIAKGVGSATEAIVSVSMNMAGSPPQSIGMATMLCRQLPVVVSMTLFWALVGGIYLLVRTDAGGQEVEDLWIPSPADPPSMPELSMPELSTKP
ncbi:hypothetical protein [Rubripirellula reticaptiva]|uniref:Uncharacterized protein n=1 Tax=Rubripirellula reticaptiva TaxID=2528013 RepID=A0A5C6EKN2_9BACT|nr:hypothetical protein [Rubripirellula reticaptiva]TWU49378.1 hypothetical protein Poly59_39930 [Rubripirellula reticaptiva]